MTRRSLIPPTAIVYDFDLTLVDSRLGFIESHTHAARQMGIPPLTEAEIGGTIGTPLEVCIPRVFPSLAADEVTEYIRICRARADEVMPGLTKVLPGAVDAVAHLREAGVKQAIVSQKLRYLIEPVLAREGFEIDAVLGAEDVPEFKPAPGGLLLALERLDAEPDDAIYVGDTTIDAEAAHNAGLRFVGVLTGPTPRADLGALPNLGLLPSIRDLPEFLGL